MSLPSLGSSPCCTQAARLREGNDAPSRERGNRVVHDSFSACFLTWEFHCGYCSPGDGSIPASSLELQMRGSPGTGSSAVPRLWFDAGLINLGTWPSLARTKARTIAANGKSEQWKVSRAVCAESWSRAFSKHAVSLKARQTTTWRYSTLDSILAPSPESWDPSQTSDERGNSGAPPAQACWYWFDKLISGC